MIFHSWFVVTLWCISPTRLVILATIAWLHGLPTTFFFVNVKHSLPSLQLSNTTVIFLWSVILQEIHNSSRVLGGSSCSHHLYKAMLYSMVLDQLSAIGECLLGTEAGGTGIIKQSWEK